MRIPVIVVDRVLPDVPRSVREPAIGGGEIFQFVKSAQELNIIQLPLPVDTFQAQTVHDVLPDVLGKT